ncbi:MAG: hypothetical protein P8X66_16690 [Maritimibacter sp.]
MNRILALAIASVFSLASCAEILQSPTLPVDNTEAAAAQEEFNIVVDPLTLDLAKKLRRAPYAPYQRNVIRTGTGASAGVISEGSVTRRVLPPFLGPEVYRLGLGDEVTFAQFADGSTASLNDLINSGNRSTASLVSGQVLTSKGRVGSDGSVLLLGLGKLDLGGKTISEARDIVRNALIRSGGAPKFQLEITGFNSKKVYLVSNVAGSRVIPRTDQGLTLRELVAATGKGLDGKAVIVIRIQRGGNEYRMNAEDLFKVGAQDIYLRDQDQVIIEAMGYKPGQVYVLGAVAPLTIPIAPEARQTLADVLFAPGGAMASPTAQRSEVYLLRGSNPVHAYMLDATNPTRLLVAAAMELRPNDIIYVPEQPLASLGRALVEVTPLRLLVRDINAGNIP